MKQKKTTAKKSGIRSLICNGKNERQREEGKERHSWD